MRIPSAGVLARVAMGRTSGRSLLAPGSLLPLDLPTVRPWSCLRVHSPVTVAGPSRNRTGFLRYRSPSCWPTPLPGVNRRSRDRGANPPAGWPPAGGIALWAMCAGRASDGARPDLSVVPGGYTVAVQVAVGTLFVPVDDPMKPKLVLAPAATLPL
jgi:hypothetical protein